MAEGPSRLELARYAYDGVYDYDKHQDDKTGRFLAALAFLASAGVVVATAKPVYLARYELGTEGSFRLPLILMATFLVLAIITLLMLVTSLGPTITFGKPTQPSHLFFLAIARQTPAEWKQNWDDSETVLEREVAEDFIVGAQHMALNVDFKYHRINEARALFTVALLAFALGLVLAANALGLHAAQPRYDWTMAARIEIVAVEMGFISVAVYEQRRLRQRTERLDASIGRTAAGTFAWLWVACVGFSASCTLPVDGWPRTIAAVAAGLAGFLGAEIGTKLVTGTGGERLKSWIWVPSLAVALPVAVFMWSTDEVALLALAGTFPVLVLTLPRWLRSYFDWKARATAAASS